MSEKINSVSRDRQEMNTGKISVSNWYVMIHNETFQSALGLSRLQHGETQAHVVFPVPT